MVVDVFLVGILVVYVQVQNYVIPIWSQRPIVPFKVSDLELQYLLILYLNKWIYQRIFQIKPPRSP